MHRILTASFCVVVSLASTALLVIGAEPTDRPTPPVTSADPIRVLFLGDRGHHKPGERAAQLLPYLAARGIEARYTEDQDELSPQALAGVDAVLIYANDESITPGQEKALLDYVHNGG